MTKPTKSHVPSAKTQISLGICPIWPQSSLSTWRKLGPLATHWAHSKDSDQTGWMPRLIWVFAGHTVILLFLSWGGSNLLLLSCKNGNEPSSFKHASAAIQWGKTSESLSEASSSSPYCVSEQWRLWPDCVDVQARLSFGCLHML